MILYLHGFRSSPLSHKATLMQEALRKRGYEERWRCPSLPASPRQALELANSIIAGAEADQGLVPERELVVVGSSLGGYYAGCLAWRWGCPAVLLNPVIHAARDLATQVGRHTLYHSDEVFVFLQAHVEELAAMAVPRPRDPRRYYLLAAKGDEVLDWREMAEWYAGAQGHILEGGDHGLSDFERWLPEVLDFALTPA